MALHRFDSFLLLLLTNFEQWLKLMVPPILQTALNVGRSLPSRVDFCPEEEAAQLFPFNQTLLEASLHIRRVYIYEQHVLEW